MSRVSFSILVGAFISLAPISLKGQTTFTAWDVSSAAVGNQWTKDDKGFNYGICNDFEVLAPITVSQLGMFDSGGDGIQGSGSVIIQLYQASGKKGTLLLETATFDAANPGELRGGFRFKPLPRPVTLWPGRYTFTANGFDETNLAFNVTKPSNNTVAPRVILNDGGGLIRFLGCNRYHEKNSTLDRSKQEKNIGPPDRFAAGTFVFAPAVLTSVPYAGDYNSLVTGLRSFPIDTAKSNRYPHGKVTLNHYGSIALLNDGAFPVLVEPGGTRLILAAAATYDGNPSKARCVAFAHEQWAHALTDARGVLFENAIKWASRKSNPSDIVMGITTNMNVGYFQSKGYQVRTLNRNMEAEDPNPMDGCDVLVVDFHLGFSDVFMRRAADFTANGGGLVATFLPWRFIHGTRRPLFDIVNNLLQPFGIAYRASLTQPSDLGFTNIQTVPFPNSFQAFPAAESLYKDRKGLSRLDSLEKATAVHTMAYAADGKPDLLSELNAVYTSGRTNINRNVEPPSDTMGSLTDVLVLNGGQASTNRLGRWAADGNALVARETRGGLEYEINVPAPDLYRLQVEATQGLPNSVSDDFDLLLSLDGLSLGRYTLRAGYGTNGTVNCWLPYLTPGPHRLRIFWDGTVFRTALRVNAVRLQSAAGTDSDGDGIKDWVAAWVNARSGLDSTNLDLTSIVSPVCLEGRDPYPSLMQVTVAGADASSLSVNPRPAPNGRWYANIPLANAGNTTVQITYQNGAKSETRQVRWALVNVLQGGRFTVRKADAMALVARPQGWASGGTMQFLVNTNQSPVRNASQQMSYRFNDVGLATVWGTYTSSRGVSQSGSITVNVVDHSFADNPDCWVGRERTWDLSSIATQVVLDADSRLFIDQIADLPKNGHRFALLIDEAEPRYILSRLGDSGPVLDSSQVRGFRLFGASDTFNRLIRVYPDGSQLVETVIVLSPVLPDLKVQVRVITGGVTFEDGSTFLELTSADFDALGRRIMRFIKPASARTSNCHTVKIFQGDALLGGY